MRGDGIVAAASNGASRRPRLTLLDAFDLSDGAEPVPLCLPVQRLLAFLALRGRPTRRAHVAFTLWTDSSEDRAFGSLRSALWRLRRDGHCLVEEANGRLRLAPAVRVDVHERGRGGAPTTRSGGRDRRHGPRPGLPRRRAAARLVRRLGRSRARALPPASRPRTRTAVRAARRRSTGSPKRSRPGSRPSKASRCARAPTGS